ncbi:MAG: hypothetical protein QXS90_01185 [Candidatus Diapherotrites archaeon]
MRKIINIAMFFLMQLWLCSTTLPNQCYSHHVDNYITYTYHIYHNTDTDYDTDHTDHYHHYYYYNCNCNNIAQTQTMRYAEKNETKEREKMYAKRLFQKYNLKDKLNRQNSYIGDYYYKGRRAIVWGNKDVSVSPMEFIVMWKSKKRATPLALALAKAVGETGLRPFLYRYEVWADPNGTKEVDYTSGGLFQALGIALSEKNNINIFLSVKSQMDEFDNYMGKILNEVSEKKLAQDIQKGTAHKDIAYRAIMYYGMPAYRGTRYHELADKHYNLYKEFQEILNNGSEKELAKYIREKYNSGASNKKEWEEKDKETERNIRRLRIIKAIGITTAALVIGTTTLYIIRKYKKT